MSLLEIKNLHVSVENQEILKGLSFKVEEGEVVAILGPNGHGKSTLFNVIMGHPKYQVLEGEVLFDGKNILDLPTDERARLGLFLGFQNPVEVPGVSNQDFLKSAVNATRNEKISLYKFYKLIDTATKEMQIPFEMVNRNLNEGFSGGEKKRNEILQMNLLEPKLALLDEIDSGLDVDAINLVSDAVNKIHSKNNTTFLVISHYARLFQLIKPTRAIVIVNGKVAVDGDSSVYERIDKEGYEWIKKELNIEIKKEEKVVSIGTCATKEAIKNVK